ncbi:MAG: hypothetical protein KAX26_17970 [Anaerolineae bacterium]|nr:hypothetical protein [Anaerolineae bacterium]
MLHLGHALGGQAVGEEDEHRGPFGACGEPSRTTEKPDWNDRELRDIVGASDAAGRIYGKKVRSNRLPSVDLLAEGEPGGEGREWWYLADVLYNRDLPWWPVWWKVRAELEPAPYGEGTVVKGWVVTDRTLCPSCLRPAAEGAHDHCRWDEMGWRPEEETLPAQNGQQK